jgi:hypothetical protein
LFLVALDGESVLMVAPPGPMLIDNNQMENWFVAFFIGGGDPGSMYGGSVLSNPMPTLTSATLSNVAGLNVGEEHCLRDELRVTYLPRDYGCLRYHHCNQW